MYLKIWISTILFFLSVSLVISCSENEPEISQNKLSISAPEVGAGIYLDGKYTGLKVPNEIELSKGQHVIGVAQDNSRTYLRKEIEITGDMTVKLTETDQPEPQKWKALWIGVHEATSGGCSTHFSKEELDEAYDYFMWSIEDHFEKLAYNTIKWDVTRKDLTNPVTLDVSESGSYVIEPSTMAGIVPEIKPGVYDAVFVFWREKEGDCSFESPYFGLAWLDPLGLDIKTGYVIVKFDAKNDLTTELEWYKNNDPGVWVHEWLHTVGEYYFQDLGIMMPVKKKGLMVHAAEIYHYKYPWMDWYEDIMLGRVKSGSEYVGIGPEAFLKYCVRETATGN